MIRSSTLASPSPISSSQTRRRGFVNRLIAGEARQHHRAVLVIRHHICLIRNHLRLDLLHFISLLLLPAFYCSTFCANPHHHAQRPTQSHQPDEEHGDSHSPVLLPLQLPPKLPLLSPLNLPTDGSPVLVLRKAILTSGPSFLGIDVPHPPALDSSGWKTELGRNAGDPGWENWLQEWPCGEVKEEVEGC